MSDEDNDSSMVLQVAVGSTNPVKVNSVVAALEEIISHNNDDRTTATLQLEGFDVESGVAAQPMGDDETQQGAKNRALAAYKAYEKKFKEPPHLAVGLEGGLEWSNDGKVLWCMAWMSCYGKREDELVDLFGGPHIASSLSEDQSKKLVFGTSKTASFAIPPPVTELVKQGEELGDADDKVFDRVNGKHGSGTVGILSNGIIDRAAYYKHALILALVPWIRADVFPNGCES